ncbi:hypothetical protein B0H67DRAFT_679716 [Lasiosphaeris hirsuta]|uniref:Uncharacterized protein n=1 Tax=Lasiosphaeris hirsuta TaxID=260670 RepID=A0AA40BE77_9PEZI|nr:hypothetical protein B0H67DRAFT_679716 [Lasiosphaeris hirsuta]
MARKCKPRTAIVTGGARGIGRAIALGLARNGYNVTVNNVSSAQPLIDETVAAIRALGRQAHGHAAAVSSLGLATGLVKPLLEVTPEDFERMFAANVASVHYCYHNVLNCPIPSERYQRQAADDQLELLEAAARQLIAQGTGGKLIGAASIVAFKPFALLGHYSASKWAVRGLTQAYAMELAEHGIIAKAYAPGIVDTPMWELIDEGLAKKAGKAKGDMITKYSREYIALGRTSVPEDVAKLVGFLASPAAEYITGPTYIVDGGIIFT